MKTFNEYVEGTYGKPKGADFKVLTKDTVEKSSVHPNSWYFVVDVRRTIGNAEQPYMVNVPGAAVFISTSDVEEVKEIGKTVSPSFQAQMDKLLDYPEPE